MLVIKHHLWVNCCLLVSLDENKRQLISVAAEYGYALVMDF